MMAMRQYVILFYPTSPPLLSPLFYLTSLPLGRGWGWVFGRWGGVFVNFIFSQTLVYTFQENSAIIWKFANFTVSLQQQIPIRRI